MSRKGARVEVLGVVLPGDEILQLGLEKNKDAICIGPGLRCQEGVVYATRSGLLSTSGKNLYYVDSHQKRYIPQEGEFVIGIILKHKGDNFLINIGGSEHATLSHLVFENDNRKARKKIHLGDLIFGQILVTSRDKEPEFVSIDVFNNNVGIASLPDNGILFNVPLHVARIIANPRNSFLKTISKEIKYTIVVGFNGRVWLYSEKLSDVVAVMNCVMMLEVLPLEEAEKNVHMLIRSLSS